MGGNNFAREGLLTPRMSPSVYQKILQDITGKLRGLYTFADTPIEAPAKVDYGDIDILATSIGTAPSEEEIAQTIGATHVRRPHGSATTFFALPWPEDLEAPATNVENITPEPTIIRIESGSPKGTVGRKPLIQSQPRHIQVDVHVCESVCEFQFLMFQHAHGDFTNIIGGMIRPYGLTLTHDGLYIRIEELELWDRKKARVPLTQNPDEVLKFLGLDVHQYWSRFASYDETMSYAATCHFFEPTRGRDLNDDRASRFINSDDVRRAKHRPMFAYWINEFLPSHRDTPPGRWAKLSRSEVLGATMEHFGDEVVKLFSDRRAEGVRVMRISKLWSDVRQAIPAVGSDLTFAMKGLKAQISEPTKVQNSSVIQEDQMRAQQAFHDGRFDVVKEWALANWREIGTKQKKVDEEISRQKLQEHLQKRRQRQQSESIEGLLGHTGIWTRG